MDEKINIAIDGYSSCGKGTLARYMANQTNYRYVDSGAMYRAVAWYVIKQGIDNNLSGAVASALPDISIDIQKGEFGKNRIFINSQEITQEIRDLAVASEASKIARIAEVRSFLVLQQQKIAKNKGVIMDGRDIGTVVLPDAELKIFMTARPEIRAERRLMELHAAGVETTYASVLQSLKERDLSDTTRKESPLLLTEDYRILDNSDMGFDEQNEIAMKWYDEIIQAIRLNNSTRH